MQVMKGCVLHSILAFLHFCFAFNVSMRILWLKLGKIKAIHYFSALWTIEIMKGIAGNSSVCWLFKKQDEPLEGFLIGFK